MRMNLLRHQIYKTENTRRKCLNNIRQKISPKIENSLLELGKDYREFRETELKDR